MAPPPPDRGPTRLGRGGRLTHVPTDGRRPRTRRSIPGVSGICNDTRDRKDADLASAACLGHLRTNVSIAGRMKGLLRAVATDTSFCPAARSLRDRMSDRLARRAAHGFASVGGQRRGSLVILVSGLREARRAWAQAS